MSSSSNSPIVRHSTPLSNHHVEVEVASMHEIEERAVIHDPIIEGAEQVYLTQMPKE